MLPHNATSAQLHQYVIEYLSTVPGISLYDHSRRAMRLSNSQHTYTLLITREDDDKPTQPVSQPPVTNQPPTIYCPSIQKPELPAKTHNFLLFCLVLLGSALGYLIAMATANWW